MGGAWVGPGGRVGDVEDQVHDRRRVGVGLEVTYWRCRTLPAPGGETWAEGPEAALLRLVWFHTVFLSLSVCGGAFAGGRIWQQGRRGLLSFFGSSGPLSLSLSGWGLFLSVFVVLVPQNREPLLSSFESFLCCVTSFSLSPHTVLGCRIALGSAVQLHAWQVSVSS